MEIFVFGAKKAFKIAKNVVSKSYNMEIRSPAKSYNMEKKRSGNRVQISNADVIHDAILILSSDVISLAQQCVVWPAQIHICRGKSA